MFCISHQSGRAFCYEATLRGDLHGSAGRIPNLGKYCLSSRCTYVSAPLERIIHDQLGFHLINAQLDKHYVIRLEFTLDKH